MQTILFEFMLPTVKRQVIRVIWIIIIGNTQIARNQNVFIYLGIRTQNHCTVKSIKVPFDTFSFQDNCATKND